jgi:hypothetical protein
VAAVPGNLVSATRAIATAVEDESLLVAGLLGLRETA